MIRPFFLGFIKVHILHCAVREPFYGLWLIEELARRGYKLGPGTLYPLLHAMENEKLLTVRRAVVKGKVRKYYEATTKGRKALEQTLIKIRKLVREILDEGTPPRR